MANNTKIDIYQLVTDRIIEEMEKGIIPWNKPWGGMMSGAYSRSTGKPYSLLNQIMLDRPGEYLTFKQAIDAGGNVKKGEKGKMVVFWKMYPVEKLNEKNEKTQEFIPVLRYYTVFHIDQCEGIEPKYKPEDRQPVSRSMTADEIINEYTIRENLTIREGYNASYSPTFDHVTLPTIDCFNQTAEYYSTAFHELVHSTGHSKRLNRFAEGAKAAAFGSEEYSKEELIAEIGAATLNNIADNETQSSFKNSVAYLQSWIKALKNDKRMIVTASGKAEKAVNYILGIQPANN